MKWLRYLGMLLAGVLVAVGLGMLGRDARAARKSERKVEELLADGSEKALNKAVKETEKAEAAKIRAEEARTRTETRLREIAEHDEDMGALLTAFDGERVRQQSR